MIACLLHERFCEPWLNLPTATQPMIHSVEPWEPYPAPDLLLAQAFLENRALRAEADVAWCLPGKSVVLAVQPHLQK
jgi:hypothetical protein